MLAACINDEDLLRVQTPLTILNDFPPFNRTNNKWETTPLPATAGVEGVGIVIAAAKNLGRPDAAEQRLQQLPGFTPPKEEEIFEVKDWVVALPDARARPLGCWSGLIVCDASRLLKVPAQLLPLQHYACSRALCTAYRLLEDYGSLRPGDTVIQNAADLPVGQAVIQLCHMLKIRTINLVTDDDGFERTKELLMQLGATHVLRDNSKLADFLDALGSEMPRLALDALGGEVGKRLAIALRPGYSGHAPTAERCGANALAVPPHVSAGVVIWVQPQPVDDREWQRGVHQDAAHACGARYRRPSQRIHTHSCRR